MNIKLNGAQVSCDRVSLADLIRDRGFNPESLIAEVNLEIIRQEDWPAYVLKDGDAVELLNFVGGG